MRNDTIRHDDRPDLATPGRRRTLATIVGFGAMWGFAEATVGFLLHALPRLFAMPNMAGAIMFPLALLFMIGAIRATGRPSAAIGAATVAAAIKASSVALPMVRFVFVRNPSLAILAEGAVVTIAAAAGVVPFIRRDEDRPNVVRIAAAALGIAVGWRAMFLLVNVALGISGGIISKPMPVLIRFVTLDSLWNMALIALVVLLTGAPAVASRDASAAPDSRSARAWRASPGELIHLVAARPFTVAVLVALATAAEWGTALVPV